MKVLLAEDDGAIRMLHSALITSLGHDVVEVADGEEAWSAFLEERPDVVITDRTMPVLDGFALCRRIRAHSEGKRVSIIVATGHGEADEILEGMGAGADDYLVKPVETFDLRVRLIAAERVAALHRQLEQSAAELSKLNQELHVTARTDGLTGVGNRRRFEEDLESTQANAIRSGDCFGVAIADVDHFKQFNDRFGHQAGDAALRAAAAALTLSCRRGDAVYRYGGEEFAIIYRHASLSGIASAAERARAAVAAIPASEEDGMSGALTMSLGVAWPASGEVTPLALVAAADAALYAAKAEGRNRVVVVEP